MTPSEVRASLRKSPDDRVWPGARVRADLGGGRLELEPAAFSPDDVAPFAVGDQVEVVAPDFASPVPATIAAIDARTVTFDPPVTARAGDLVNLVQLAPEA